MLCWLIKPHPNPSPKGRGEWYALLVDKASPPAPLQRGEGSSMFCWLIRPHPQPLSKRRGEWYVLLVQERFSVDEKTC